MNLIDLAVFGSQRGCSGSSAVERGQPQIGDQLFAGSLDGGVKLRKAIDRFQDHGFMFGTDPNGAHFHCSEPGAIPPDGVRDLRCRQSSRHTRITDFRHEGTSQREAALALKTRKRYACVNHPATAPSQFKRSIGDILPEL
jgi:hypothetical protein